MKLSKRVELIANEVEKKASVWHLEKIIIDKAKKDMEDSIGNFKLANFEEGAKLFERVRQVYLDNYESGDDLNFDNFLMQLGILPKSLTLTQRQLFEILNQLAAKLK